MKASSLLVCGLLILGNFAYAVSPQPPFPMELNEDAITSLNLNDSIETLLIFPHELRLLSGRGFTMGKEEGVVQYQIGKISNILHLRPLEAEFDILAKVMVQDSVYVFRLSNSDTPATVIRFAERLVNPDEDEPTAELNNSQVAEMTRVPSLERQQEMIRLVAEEHKLRPQLPHLYETYHAKEFDVVSSQGPFEISLEYIGRFYGEDCLVFSGTVSTTSTVEAVVPYDEFQLQIGDSGEFALSQTIYTRASVTKEKPAFFIGVLVGDGDGRPGHYRLENDFSITLRR